MAPAAEALLGRPGDVVDVAHRVDELSTRIGGLPLYPAGRAPPSALTACAVCGQQLVLLVQAHAPLPAEGPRAVELAQRFLYLFGCVAEGCGTQPGSWTALRCQLEAQPDFLTLPGSEVAATAAAATRLDEDTATAAAPAAAAGVAWGLAEDDWGAGRDWGVEEDKSTASCGSTAFDFADLNAALDAAGTASQGMSTGKKSSQGVRQATATAVAEAAVQKCSVPPRTAYSSSQATLPAFYLYAQPESECEGSSSSSNRQAEEHLQQLVQRYEQESMAGGMAAAGVCLPAPEGGPESWAGEGYEEDTVLQLDRRRTADVADLKFSRRLARCPDQCARYWFGGTPLWPSARPPTPQRCPRCGGERVFELQLMTPAIPYLEESAEWLGGGEAGTAQLVRPPDSWEWMTVAVFTCAASCGGSAVAVREEVQLCSEEGGSPTPAAPGQPPSC